MKRSKILVCAILCMVFAFMFTSNARAEGSASLNGLVEEGGSTYYYVDGVKQYDYFGEIEGGYRYFDAETGAMVTGAWVKLNPYEYWEWNWYYFDEEGIAPNGCYTVKSVEYYFYADGELADGYVQYVYDENDVIEINNAGQVARVKYKINNWTNAFGEWFWFEDIEAPANGLKEIGGVTYYFYDGLMASDMLVYLEDGSRYFAPSGAMLTNTWQLHGNAWEPLRWYYFETDGTGAQGWRKLGGLWYYFDNGATRIGDYVMEDEGVKYYFNFATDGRMTAQIKMQNGWLQNGGAWYYWDEGANDFVKNRWETINGALYRFSSWGELITSSVIDGYVVDASGRRAYNTWVYLEGSQTYAWANADGKAQKGWRQIGGITYWFDQRGRMANETTSFYDDNGQLKIHRFASSGQWLGEVNTTNGWEYDGDQWRYYENGSYVTGWKPIGGAWYYFYTDGSMVQNTTRYDSYYGKTYVFGPSGALANGWVNVGSDYGYNQWYLADANGVLQTGWQLVGHTWYYLEHSMYQGLCYIMEEDAWHLFADSGAWLGEVNMVDGWNLLNGKWYYFENDDLAYGWIKSGGQYYYMDGTMVTDYIWSEIYSDLEGKGYYYGFNVDGTLAKNKWIYVKNYGYVYCDSMGVFTVNEGTWYY